MQLTMRERAGPAAVALRAAPVVAVSYGATALSLGQFRFGGIGSPVWWPTTGLVVAIMVRSPRRWWWVLTIAFMLGCFLGSAAFDTWSVAVTYSVAGVVEMVVLSVVLTSRHGGRERWLRTPAEAARVVSAMAAALAVSAGVLVVGSALGDAPDYAVLPGFIGGHGVGLLIAAPVLLPKPAAPPPSSRRNLEFGLVLAVVVAAGSAAFLTEAGLIRAFPVLLPVIWAALRLGAVRATAITVVAASLAAYGSAHGRGTFMLIASATDRHLTGQLFAATAATACLMLILITRHRVLLAELARDRENTLRVAVRDALVGMYSLRFDPGHVGEIRDANRALTDMLGYQPGELDGRNARLLAFGPRYADTVDAADLADFDAWMTAFARGEPESFRRETPFSTKDGGRRWVEVSATRVTPTGDAPFALVHVHDLTDRLEHQRMLEHMAMHDALTGLANRALLFERITEKLAAAHGAGPRGTVGLLFVDLDDFKTINDTHGHAAGDRILVQVARRLTNAVRPADTVARLGGDEFAILCAPIDRGDELAAIAHRIRRALAEPVRLLATSTTIAIRGSIGTAVADAATTPDSLVRAADAAMYLDKRSGRRPTGEDKAVPV
jgi:diguanylate cyclase (GGDEF)-like protein/PAS domain S-box-containing protein